MIDIATEILQSLQARNGKRIGMEEVSVIHPLPRDIRTDAAGYSIVVELLPPVTVRPRQKSSKTRFKLADVLAVDFDIVDRLGDSRKRHRQNDRKSIESLESLALG